MEFNACLAAGVLGVTTQANEIVSRVHDRMPVILMREVEEQWLDPAWADPASLLKPSAADRIDGYEVGTVVNSAQNEGPECVQRV